MPRTRNPENARARRRAELAKVQYVMVKLGRLGEEVSERAVKKGTTVQKILDDAGIDGSVVAVKLNGRKVNLTQKVTRDCTLVAIAEIEGG